MRSLSRTLVLGTTLGTAAVLVAAGVLLYALVRTSLTRQFDRSLGDKAILFASTIEEEHGEIELEFKELDMGEFRGRRPSAYLQLWGPDGAVLYRSSGLAAAGFEPWAGAPGESLFRSMTLPDGRRGRAVSLRVMLRREKEDERRREADEEDEGEDEDEAEEDEEDRRTDPERASEGRSVVLVMARSTDALDSVLIRLAAFLSLVGLLAVAGGAAVLGWIVRRSLRPLRRLADEIAQIREENLSNPIDPGAAPREIEPVVETLNDLLRRLHSAIERERAFSANVAHELRNPLAGLQLKMDVATSRRRQPDEYHQALEQCRRIATQMETMVENLLSLGRLETGQVEPRFARVSVPQLIRNGWRPLNSLAEDRQLQVEWSTPPELPLVTDASLLQVALGNVFENAVTYANEGGRVAIGAASVDHGVEISVRNSGSLLSAADAEHVFDRFWRGDQVRSDAGVHCGLGLALAKKVVTVLGGKAIVESVRDGDFVVRIRLPDRAGDDGTDA